MLPSTFKFKLTEAGGIYTAELKTKDTYGIYDSTGFITNRSIESVKRSIETDLWKITTESGKVRGFEVADGWEDESINLPKRQTKNAAGYDFESAEEVTIKPIWQHVFQVLISKMNINADPNEQEKLCKPTLVHTGVKAYMQEDEGLFIYNRSSNPIKKFLLLGNGVGVVDSDYYENESNDGEIMFQFINFGIFPVTIKKGDRVGQGIFQKFFKTDDDSADGERIGGHGSTGK